MMVNGVPAIRIFFPMASADPPKRRRQYAWLITATYYFYQYALRSAPAVMMPQLSDAFGVSAMGVASIVGLFYYGYSPFSLVAGLAMDRLGPRNVARTPEAGEPGRS